MNITSFANFTNRAIPAFVLCLALAGCSVVKTRFVDADQTTYEATLILAPFSKLDDRSAMMAYKWDTKGDNGKGQINVGESTKGLDQTAQTDVVQAAIAAAVAAALKGVKP